jgi:hypothetical protein
LKGKYPLVCPGAVDIKVILKYIFRNCSGKLWISFVWLRIGISGALLRTLKQPSDSIKGRQFLD